MLLKTIDIGVCYAPTKVFQKLAELLTSNYLNINIHEGFNKEIDDVLIIYEERIPIMTKLPVIQVYESHRVHDTFYDVWHTNDLTYRCREYMRHLEYKYLYVFYKYLSQAMADTTDDMVWVKDKEGLYKLGNKSFCKAVNKEISDILGRDHNTVWDVPVPVNETVVDPCLISDAEVVSKRTYCEFDENIYVHGEIHKLSTGKSPVFNMDGDVVGVVAVGKDVTHETMYKRFLYNLAMVDGLTSAYNRNYIEKVILPTTPIKAVAFIDINNFKSINDTMGHDDGDIALKLVASSLIRYLPSYIVVRWGGDEFIVVNTSKVDFKVFEVNVKNAVSNINTLLKNAYFNLDIGLSVGIVEANGESFYQLVNEADGEMYYVKTMYKMDMT